MTGEQISTMSSSTKMSVLAALNLKMSTTTLGVSFTFRINIPSFLIDDTNILNHIFFHDFCLADWEHTFEKYNDWSKLLFQNQYSFIFD